MFKKTPINLEKYIELIGDCKTNKFINKNIKQMEKAITSKNVNIDDSLKMTHLDMDEIFTDQKCFSQ